MPAPIMNAGFYLRNPQGKRRKAYDENGKAQWERLPSSAGRRRDRAMLRDDGHVVYQPLTSHSANLDMECTQATFYKKKAKNLNWIPTAQCPVVLAMSGQIDPRSLCVDVQKALKKNEGCQPDKCSEQEPCKHLNMERIARQDRQNEVEVKRAAAHKGPQEKLLEAQRETQALIGAGMHRMAAATPATTEKAKPATEDKASK